MAKRGKISELYDIANIKAQQAKVISLVKNYVKEVNSVNAKIGQSGSKPSEIISNIEKINSSNARQAATVRELTKEQALANIQTAERNKMLKLQAQFENSVNGSREQAVAKIKILEFQLHQLGVTTEFGKKKQSELNSEIEKYNLLLSKPKPATPAQPITQSPVVSADNTAAEEIKLQEAEQIKFAQSIEYTTQQQLELNAAIESGAASGNKRAQLITEPEGVKESAKAVTVYKDELEKLTGTVDENQKLQAIYTSEISDVDNKLKVLKKTTDDSAKGSKKYQDELAGLTSRQKQLKTDLKEVNTTLGLQAKENNSAAGSIDQLRARYALLLREIERGGTAFKTSGPGKIILAETQIVKTALDKAEREALLFRGSLSNTGSAITGFASKAFGALRNFAYLIPGLGLAGLIGIIVDPIVKYAKELLNAGKSLDKFKGSQESLNKALDDSSYKDAVKNVKELTTYIDLAKKGFLSKKDVLDEYNKTLGDTIGKASSLDEAEQLLVKNGEAYIKITLLKAAANVALNEAAQLAVDIAKEQNNRNQNLAPLEDEAKFRRVIENQAEFQRLNQLVNEGYGKSVIAGNEASKNLEKYYQDQLVFLSGGTKAKNKKTLEEIAADFQKNAALLANDFNIDLFGNKDKEGKDKNNRLEFFDDLLKLRRDAFLEISKDEDKHITERISAREDAFKIDKELIEGRRKFDIINAKGNVEDISNINKVAIEQLKKIESDKEKEIGKIKDKFLKDNLDKIRKNQEGINKILQDQRQAEISHLASVHETELQEIQNRYDEELNELDKKFSRGLIKEEDYNKRKLDIQIKLQKALLLEDIKFTKDTLAAAEARAIASGSQEDIDAVASAKSKLAALEIKLGRIVTESVIKDNKDKETAEAKLHDKRIKRLEEIASIASQAFGIISSISNIASEKEKNRLQGEIDLLEEKKQKDIEVANQTIVNAQDRAAAISVIEARAEAQRTQLEIKKRQAQERQARFEKAATIASLIAETALAVVRALGAKPFTPINIATAAIVGALGAAKIAVAIATPIHKYKYGGVHSGGIGEVGHGKPEAIKTPDGNLFKTPATPTLLDMPKGTVIYPDFNKLVVTASMKQLPVFKEINKTDESFKIIGGLKSIETAVKKIPQQKITVENIISRRIRSGGNTTDFINRK